MNAAWVIAIFVFGAIFGASVAAWYLTRAIHFLGLSTEVAVRTLGKLAESRSAPSQERIPE